MLCHALCPCPTRLSFGLLPFGCPANVLLPTSDPVPKTPILVSRIILWVMGKIKSTQEVEHSSATKKVKEGKSYASSELARRTVSSDSQASFDDFDWLLGWSVIFQWNSFIKPSHLPCQMAGIWNISELVPVIRNWEEWYLNSIIKFDQIPFLPLPPHLSFLVYFLLWFCWLLAFSFPSHVIDMWTSTMPLLSQIFPCKWHREP